MSAIAGIFVRTEESVTQEQLDSLNRTLQEAGPDGEEQVLCEKVGFLHRPFFTSEMARRTRQPVCSPSGAMLVWDGRLDNRSELRCMLSRVDRPLTTDADLVLAAYDEWGSRFPGKLIGDFAFAIWDPKHRSLLLARDPFGIRTLYYCADERTVTFSTTLKSLLQAGVCDLSLDEDFIADFLTTTSFSGKTPFRQILAVPPGVSLTFTPEGMKDERFWSLDPSLDFSYGSDAEYEEHFRELFFESVRCRLPEQGNVFSELSGGLDSSSIVCVADALLRQAGESGERLKTLSYVFDDAPTSDERAFIRCVEEKIGRQGIHLSELETPLLSPLEDSTVLPYPSADHLFSRRQTAVREAMEAADARVLLRGTAGDHVVWGEVVQPYQLADHLFKKDLGSFTKSLSAWSQELQVPYLQLTWNAGLLPFMPRNIQKMSARSIDREPSQLFAPDFVDRLDLKGRMLGAEHSKKFRLPSRQKQYEMIHDAAEQVSRGFFLESGTLETTYPFLHRPLVEFCMAIEMDQKLRPGETRSILRRSLKSYLPEPVRTRKSKRGPDEALLKALARRADYYLELFENPRVEAYGYVDAEKAREILKLACHGCSEDSVSLTDVIALEMWLRSIERNLPNYRPSQTLADTGTSSESSAVLEPRRQDAA